MSESKTFDFCEALRQMKLGKSVTCYEMGVYCLSLSGGLVFCHRRAEAEDAWVRWEPVPSTLGMCLMSDKWSIVETPKVYTVKYYDRDGNFIEERELSSVNVRHDVSYIINLGSNNYWQASITGNGIDCLVETLRVFRTF